VETPFDDEFEEDLELTEVMNAMERIRRLDEHEEGE
jgi:hypothetical protein